MTNNQKTISRLTLHSHTGRVSVLTSVKGSITIEASMAIPIFVFAVICLLYLLEIMSVQVSVRSGMQYAGKILAQDASTLTVMIPSEVEKDIVNAVGAERLERSVVVGGSSGLECGKSRMSLKTGIATIKVEYQIRIPVPVYKLNLITKTETMKIKAWTGYEKEGFSLDNEDTVYVTDTGIVYHRDYHCTYLELSIRMVTKDQISGLRNQNGAKYYPCEFCAWRSGNGVYITDSGNRYHSSLTCSGLKRTVYAIPLSDAIGRGACSRCGR